EEGGRRQWPRSWWRDDGKRSAICWGFLARLSRGGCRGWVARPPAVVVPANGANGASSTKAGRPKTMAETMEDVALEAMQVSASVAQIAQPPAAKSDDDDGGEEAAVKLGMTVPQPESGALRPTLIIGVGGF